MGWILLHILIGFVGTLMVQGVAIGIVLVATGREDFDPTPRVGAALTLSVLAGMIAWLLFVYLNKSRRVRWVVFLAAFLSAFTLGVVVSLAAQPAA